MSTYKLLDTYIIPIDTQNNIIKSSYQNYLKSAEELNYSAKNRIFIKKIEFEEISSKHNIPNNIKEGLTNGTYKQYTQYRKELDDFIIQKKIMQLIFIGSSITLIIISVVFLYM